MPPIAPIPFDMLMRPVKYVQGAGGVFVSGDQWGFGRYVKAGTTSQAWVGVTDLPTATVESVEGPGKEVLGTIAASSYAKVDGKPTFLLAGHAASRVDVGVPFQQHALIMVSHDGKGWTTVFEKITVPPVTGLNISALVWDQSAFQGNGSFYAQAFADADELTYQSNTGLNWAQGGGKFASHCNGKLPGEPDGYYGYDKTKDILIQPNDTGGVDITTSKGKKSVKIESMGVACVAFAGGIWEAGGTTVLADGPENTACTATSIDDGKTWTQVSKGALGMHEETGQAPGIATIVGAPLGDF